MSDKKILAVILYSLWMCSVFIFTDASKWFATGIGAYKIGEFFAGMFLADRIEDHHKTQEELK